MHIYLTALREDGDESFKPQDDNNNFNVNEKDQPSTRMTDICDSLYNYMAIDLVEDTENGPNCYGNILKFLETCDTTDTSVIRGIPAKLFRGGLECIHKSQLGSQFVVSP